MKFAQNIVAVLVVVVIASAAGTANAALIADGDVIAVDFASAGGSATNFNIINSNTTISSGSVIRHSDGAVVDGVSLTFAGAVGFNDDSNGNGWIGQAGDPYYVEAANDLGYAFNTNAPITLTIGGLDDGLRYNVRVYSLFGRADALGRTETFSITDGAGTVGGTISRATRWNAATLEAGGTVFDYVRTDGAGNLVISSEGANADNPFFNAIVVEAVAVPEPTSGVLVLCVGASVLGRRRRRR